MIAASPEARTFQIRVRVGSGTFNEAKSKAGRAHLLEHYLFTNAEFEKDMTYLEAIQEKGGSGNAVTAPTETGYYATVPTKLAVSPELKAAA